MLIADAPSSSCNPASAGHSSAANTRTGQSVGADVVALGHVQGFCHRRSALVVPPALWGGMGVASMNTHLDPPLEKGYRELLIVLLECAGPRFRCCLFTAYWELLNSKSPLCGIATRIVGLGFKVKNINIRDSDMNIYSVITNNLQRQEQNQFINNNPSWQKCT